MKKLLLVLGNGFDLQCDLESSYGHFLKHNLSNIELWETFIDTLSETATDIWEVRVREFFKKFGSNFFNKYSVWDIYFLFKTVVLEENKERVVTLWCDFEKEIALSFERHKKYANFWDEAIKTYFKCLNNKINYIHRKPAAAIARLMFENSLRLKPLEKLNFPNYDFNKELWYGFVLDQLKFFESRFASFLKKQINNRYLYRARMLITHLMRNDVAFEKTSVMSFNYINLSTLLELGKEVTFCNVHGTLETETIFGIDQTNIDRDNSAFAFTKTDRIVRMNDVFINKIDKEWLNDIDTIRFYGHSLNEQDFSYFLNVFHKVNIFNSNVRIEFLYSVYDLNEAKSIRKNYEDAVVKLLSRYANELNEKIEKDLLFLRLRSEGRLAISEIEEIFNF